MERILGRPGAETPFDTAVKILEEVTAGITASPTTCQKTAEQPGAEIKALRLAEIKQVWTGEDDLEPSKVPKRLYITIEGTTVQTNDGWKEVKLAAIYETEAEEVETEPGGEADQASQITYAATFERAEEFGRRAYLEA